MSEVSVIFTDIVGYLKKLFDILKTWHDTANDFWATMPPVVGYLANIIVWIAIVGVLASLIFAIAHNVKKWKPKPDSHLMYSYFCGTGHFQWGLIYKEAYSRLYDHKWWRISFAGSAHFIGNIVVESKTILFLLSLPYIPLTVLGTIEMLVREVIGTVWFCLIAMAHGTVLLLINIVALLTRPIFKALDKTNRNAQHCPNCYYEFRLPHYVCPYCGIKHEDLAPSNIGTLFARCECGKFISPFIFSGKSKYDALCPNCGEPLGASNTRQFAIQVIGGNSTGKTAFLAAFQHMVLKEEKTLRKGHLYGHPQDMFDYLEQTYKSGVTAPSSTTEVGVATIVYGKKGRVKQNSLVFYDIPDEVILNDSYENNPLNFGHSNGIVIVIDPLYFTKVRNELEKSGKNDILIGASEDNPEDLINDFIIQYSRIVGRSANRMVSVPLAVVINKTDIEVVQNEVGQSGIKRILEANQARYRQNYSKAMNDVCREYLEKNGMTNAVNNLESTFSNIRYFSASAIGHLSSDENEFRPQGVLEPILWLTKKGSNDFHRIIDTIVVSGAGKGAS